MVDNTVYLSGVLGMDPNTNKLVDGGVLEEAKQAFLNMRHILAEAKSSYGNGKGMS